MSVFLPTQDEGTRRRRRTLWIAAALAIAAAGAGWSPAAAAFKAAHARKLTAEAEAYLAQNRPEEALESVTGAVRKGASGARALRVLLELHSRTGSRDAMRAWAMLARCVDATAEDRRQLLRWAVVWGRADLANSQWAELAGERPLSPKTARAAAGYFELRAEPRLAVEMAQHALQADQSDVEIRMLLGRVLLKHGSEADQEIGKRLLVETAERPDALGLAVLRHLAVSEKLLPFEAQQCLKKLREHPLHDRADVFTEASLQLQVTPYRRAQILADTSAAVLAAGGDAGMLGRWLLKRGAWEEVLQAASPARAAASQEVAMLRFDALAQLGRWPEMERELEQGAPSLPAFEREMFQARAAAALGKTRLADLHWRQAEEHAGKDAGKAAVYAHYAAAAGAWDSARRVLPGLEPRQARPVWEGLLLLARNGKQAGGNEKARELLEAMRKAYPDDATIQNDWAYLNLLMGKELEASAQLAQTLHQTDPERWIFRITLALAKLRNGRAGEAVALLESRPMDWRLAPAWQRAVYAAALAGAGYREKAAAAEALIRPGELHPEEHALLKLEGLHSRL